MSSSPPIYRPIPRRPFNHSSIPHQPPSPSLLPSAQLEDTPSRTHSILDLTSSTLLGIYSPTGYSSDREELSTPWGTGAETPSTSPKELRRRSVPAPAVPGSVMALSLLVRGTTLFCLGMLYGLLVRHLHNETKLAPFQVEGIIKPRNDWRYLVFWGVAGITLGNLLPWADTLWEKGFDKNDEKYQMRQHIDHAGLDSTGAIGADWTPVVRSVGAFVGIAFAIRKLPWTSTLQASLTLALVNPVLWYIIDRSKTGFIFSTLVGLAGAAVLLMSNANVMPSPAPQSPASNTTGKNEFVHGLGISVSRETIEGAIWIVSVLFCSCVCFGNIGRRLALSRNKHVEERSENGLGQNGKRNIELPRGRR